MNAIVITILAVIIVIILFGSRQWALLGFAIGILYLTEGESADVFGFNLFPLRFIELFGLLRVVVRKEFIFSRLNSIDKIFVSLYLYTTTVFILRSSDGLSYQIGIAVDALISYFTFRGLIQSISELKWYLKRFSLLLIPYCLIVLTERITFQNPFAIVGGNAWVSDFREGIPRCTGSFRHAILLGSFAVSFLPLYMGLQFDKDYKKIAFLGFGLCLAIVWLANSGGPVTSTALAFVGWALWSARRKMLLVRFGIIGILVLLLIFMKAPIWALPAKISAITGGSGWHRYYLIDRAITTFNDWWLAGMPISATRDWFPYIVIHGGADITNQFISFGIAAGIFAIIIFVLLLVKGFQVIGEELAYVEEAEKASADKFLIWGIGVMLMVHISNWFGVTYFDQLQWFWYMHIAIISRCCDFQGSSNRSVAISKSS